MTTSTETYNGWTNYETWACNLWLTNDEGMYHWSRSLESSQDLQEWVEGLSDLKQESEMLTGMFNDIGSTWRVNWNEIHESMLEDQKKRLDRQPIPCYNIGTIK